MTALTADDAVTEDMKAFAGTIFNSCGEAIWVDESAMEPLRPSVAADRVTFL